MHAICNARSMAYQTASIVFIHGFTGHPERTWTHKKGVRSDYQSSENITGPPHKLRKLNTLLRAPHQGADSYAPVYWPRDLVPTTVPYARVLTYVSTPGWAQTTTTGHAYPSHLIPIQCRDTRILLSPIVRLTFQDPDPWPWTLDSKSSIQIHGHGHWILNPASSLLDLPVELHVFRAASSQSVQDLLLEVMVIRQFNAFLPPAS